MTAQRDDATTRLTALLDRLSAELLDAPEAEAEAALRESGRARAAALQEVRALLAPGTQAAASDKTGPMINGTPSAPPARGPAYRH